MRKRRSDSTARVEQLGQTSVGAAGASSSSAGYIRPSAPQVAHVAGDGNASGIPALKNAARPR
jgi:hypothetical protein